MMFRIWIKRLFYIQAFIVSSFLAVGSGCASGGYSLTSDYSRWVNSKHIVFRVILYFLTLPIYGITLTIDAIYFNSVDFWEGRVSQGNYEFKDGDKTVYVKHEILKGSQLKRSTIQIMDSGNKLLKEIILNEKPDGDIETLVDGRIYSTESHFILAGN